jgi:hypothetical protein
MKYLHDNGFRVLTVNDLGYDTNNNFLYIKTIYHTPSLISHYIVNVTGLANNKPFINAPVPQHVRSINNPKLLLLHLAKNPINAGSKGTLKARVIDAANSNLTIAGARVTGTITDSTKTTRMNFNGTTDNSILSYTSKVSKDSKSDSSASSDSSGSHHSVYGKDHPNGKSSKRHGGYCSYIDYKSNVCGLLGAPYHKRKIAMGKNEDGYKLIFRAIIS